MAAGYLFPYLIDSPEDGCVESHGWLPLPDAATPQEAAIAFACVYEDDEPPVFSCSGAREWLIAVLEDTGESPGRTLRGLDAETHVREHHYYDELLRYEKADAAEPGAREWWRIDATPRCDRYDEDGDFYCALTEDHDGACSEKPCSCGGHHTNVDGNGGHSVDCPARPSRA